MPRYNIGMDRFYSKIRRTDDCWEWTSAKDSHGYGMFQIGGKAVGAHRIAWRLAYGEIPDGLYVLHACDNRPCVRPDHLFLGTPKDNSQDMVRKGRYTPPVIDPEVRKVARSKARETVLRNKTFQGSNHPGTRLTDVDVLAIREAYRAGVTQVKLGQAFGIEQTTVSNIVVRKSWKHL